MGIIFFVLTVLCLPFMPAGATVPRWAFLSLVCAGLLFRIELRPMFLAICAYLGLMAWVTPIGYDAAFVYWHFLLYAVLFCYVQGRIDMRHVTIGVGLGMAVNSGVVVAQYFGWRAFPEISGTLGGLFYNHALTCEMAAMVLALVVGYRLWWLVPGILPSLLAGSRAPILALGIAAAIPLWRRFDRNRFPAITVVLAAVLFVVMRSTVTQTLVDRFGVWQDTVMGLNFFGHGLGSFIGEYPLLQRHSLSLALRYENTHNDMLQVIYELGVGGLVFIALAIFQLSRVPRSPAWYALVVFGVEGCFGFPLYEPVTGALAACCAGVVFSDRAPLRDLFGAVRSRIRDWRADKRFGAFRDVGAVVPAVAHAPVGSGLRGNPASGRIENAAGY